MIPWPGTPTLGFPTLTAAGQPTATFSSCRYKQTIPPRPRTAKSFRAWNTDPGIDPVIYDANWRLTIENRKTQTYYFHLTEVPYTGQHGVYNIEVTHMDDTVEVFPAIAINQLAAPYTPPQNLEVSYSTGTTLPTFRFMPLAEPGIDYYLVRLRYWEVPYWESIEESEAGLVYRTAKIAQGTPGQPMEVTFLQDSDGQGTETPLCREWSMNSGSTPSTKPGLPPLLFFWQAAFQSQNRIYFRYPFSLYDDFLDPMSTPKNGPGGYLVREGRHRQSKSHPETDDPGPSRDRGLSILGPNEPRLCQPEHG